MVRFRFLRAVALAVALLASPFTVSGQNYTASSNSSAETSTISSGNHTISVGSSGALTRSNAITLSGGTLQGGIMDNVATVSGLSGNGTSSTNVDTNSVTIIFRGKGTSATTANLTLSSGISITGANQLLVGGGFMVLTTVNLSGTLALTAGGGSAGAFPGGGATTSTGTPTGMGGNRTSGTGGRGGAGSVAIQYAYDSNVASGNLTLSGGIT